MYITRQMTNKILEAVEEGRLNKDTVILACLKYMSESDVADMAHANEFFFPDDGDDEEPEWDDSSPSIYDDTDCEED